MKKLIIGLSPRFSTSDNLEYQYVRINKDYIKQVTSRDAICLILVEGPTLKDTLKMCDGFIVIGGNDIDPKYYGETNQEGLSKNIDPIMDEIDKEILEYATKHHIPTLGICRGVQAMAAFMGGTLHQDIKSSNLCHPSEDKKHFVTKVNDTKLTSLLPDSFLVNTYHHQAVKDAPDGFTITYVNHDVIEAMEHTTLPFVGVQWHPERYYTEESKIIFDYFFDLVKHNGKHN